MEGTAEIAINKKGGWFQKIPTDILLSPGGMVLALFAIGTEILDLIPGFFIIERVLEIVFFVFLKLIFKNVSLKAMIVVLIIECLDFLGIIPTTALKMLGAF